MAADLTVDNLCEAIRHFLLEAVEHSDKLLSLDGLCLNLVGVPADDTMKTVMAMVGGALKITVRELPAELDVSAGPGDAVGSDANLWQPSKAVGTAEEGTNGGRHEEPAGATPGSV